MGVSAGQRVTAVAAAGSSRVHGSVRANELGHFIPLCGKVKPSSLYERADVDAHLGVEINCKACLVAASELAEAGATEVMVGSRVTVAHDGPGTVVSVEGPDISVRVDSDGTVVSCDEYDIEPMGHSVVSPNEWEAELLATPVVLADPGCADEENMTHEAIDAQLSAEAASLPDGLDAARPQDATRATAKGHKIYSHLRFVYYGRGKSAAAQGIAAYIAIGGGLITVYRHADNSRVDTFGSAMKFWALPMRSLTEAEKQIIIEDYRAETARIRAAREAAGRPAKNAELRHDAYLASIVVASNCATCGPRDAKICGWCYDANSDGSRKESELI